MKWNELLVRGDICDVVVLSNDADVKDFDGVE